MILSFGISFIDISAKTDKDFINSCFDKINSADYQVTIKFYDYYEKNGVYVGYEIAHYYVYSEKVAYFSKSINHNSLLAYNDKNEVITATVYRYLGKNNNYFNSNGEPSMFVESNSINTGSYHDKNGNLVKDVPIENLIVASTFDVYVDDNLVFQKPTVPVAIVAESLPAVVGNQTQIIIGGTICLMALMIFLVVLGKHLRAVSQVS